MPAAGVPCPAHPSTYPLCTAYQEPNPKPSLSEVSASISSGCQWLVTCVLQDQLAFHVSRIFSGKVLTERYY